MGRVFSYAAIAEGRVPHISAFAPFVQRLRTAIERSSAIAGATVFGSSLYGDWTRRSDVDVCILYYSHRQGDKDRLIQKIAEDAANRSVPIQVVTVSTELAPTGLHTIDAGLLHHLRRANQLGGLIKASPLVGLKTDHLRMRTHVKTYVSRKLQSLDQRIGTYPALGQERYDFLADVLNVPIYVARKVLELRGVRLANDSRRHVLAAWQDEETADQLHRIAAVDDWYSRKVAEQLRCPKEREYDLCLAAIYRLAPVSRAFLERIAISLAHERKSPNV